MIGSFLFGVMVGAGAMWLYGNEIRQYVDDRTRTARTRMAGTLQTAADSLNVARETVEGGLSGRGGRRGS